MTWEGDGQLSRSLDAWRSRFPQHVLYFLPNLPVPLSVIGQVGLSLGEGLM